MNFKPNDNFFWYLYFMNERMSIFWKRQNGEPWPWTEDEILKNHKFTNVYKILDRASQFEISNVIYNERGLNNDYDTEDIFYRILIYKHFNSPCTWDVLTKQFGDITLDIPFEEITNFLKSYTKEHPEFTPYSNAYMLTAAFLSGEKGKYVHLKGNGWKKYEYYFNIFKEEIFYNGYIYEILQSNSLEEMYNKFMNITSFADFLSYQYIIDMNYSPLFNFDENSFARAGLGTQRGILRTFDIKGKPDFESIIHWTRENLEQLMEDYGKKFDFKFNFKPLPGRMPTNVDLSSCFCETDKFCRVSGIETPGKDIHGKRMKAQYTKASIKSDIIFNFPPKWNLNVL